MRLLKNPLTYTLIIFALVIYAPFVFAGLLFSFVFDFGAKGLGAISLYILAAFFLAIFLLASVYVQALFFSYAQKQSTAKFLDVFAGARKQYWRIALFDLIALAIVALGFVWAVLAPSNAALSFSILWTFVIGALVLRAPAYIAKHNVFVTIKKSAQDITSLRGLGVIAIATLVILVASWSSLASTQFVQVVLFTASTFAALTLATTTFFPLLLISGPEQFSFLGVALLRMLSSAIVIVALHIICAKQIGRKDSAQSAR